MTHRFLSLIGLTVILLACSLPQQFQNSDPAEPTSAPPTETAGSPAEAPAEVSRFLIDLPQWEEAYPPLEARTAAPTGAEATQSEPIVINAPVKDEAGLIVRDESGAPAAFQDVTYRCTLTPYSLTHTPEQIVMYNPDASILWAGALIQGETYADGRGSLLSLPVSERTPIIVSIPDFFNEDPSRVVDNPNLDSVTRAVNSMVGNANAEGLATPSTIAFEMKSYHSEADFAASFDVSGKYLGFEGSASGDYASSEAETTVAVHFYQQMFTVVVPPQQTPGAFFSDSFTADRLQEQIDLGRIGPDNLPVYVSEIVYGRMMMFTFTSTASEEEIRGTLNAAYNGIGKGAAVELSAGQRNLLETAKIAITSYGGDADATIAMIRSGDWSQYFTDEAPLTTAKPLSYSFRNLDGTLAQVSEAWDYNIRECKARSANSGTFEFMPTQIFDSSPVLSPATTLSGDLNGDGRLDIFINHLGPNENLFYTALAQPDGTYITTPPQIHPATAPGGWGNVELALGDINGDGRDDIVWSATEEIGMPIYVGFSQGDGRFELTDPQLTPAEIISEGTLIIGEINGDGLDDLIWNQKGDVFNDIYTALSNGDGTFDLNLRPIAIEPSDFGEIFSQTSGDINGDGLTDLVWNLDGSPNLTIVALADPQSEDRFRVQRPFRRDQICCGVVQLVGDINGDTRDDLVWNNTPAANNTAWIGLTQPTNSFDINYSAINHEAPAEWMFFTPYLADVTGDGRADLIWNDIHSTSNQIYVGVATANGQFAFDYSRVPQTHPDLDDWSTATVHIGDVNGDAIQDIVWFFAGAYPRAIVALAIP